MSEQNANGEKRLTVDDPVSQETIQAFRQIQAAQADVSVELMMLEQRKIQLMAAFKKLQEQHDRTFQGVLVERGLPPNTAAELEGKTGRLILKTPPKPQQEPTPQPQP